MRPTSYLLLALATAAAAASLHAPPDPPPLLPPLPPLPGAEDASPLANQLTLTPDQAAAAKQVVANYKNSSAAALTSAKAAVNASVTAAASKLNATIAAKEKLFSDAVLLPGGGIRAGGLRGGGLMKKPNFTDGFLSSELALASGVKAQAQQAVSDAKTAVTNAWAARKLGV